MLGLTPKLKKHFEKAFGMSSIESNFYASMVGGVVAAGKSISLFLYFSISLFLHCSISLFSIFSILVLFGVLH